jgi:hypothetical protein
VATIPVTERANLTGAQWALPEPFLVPGSQPATHGRSKIG